MKKIMIMFAIFAIFAESSFAVVTTCAKTGTYVGILKKNVSGTSTDSDSTTKAWRVVYSYKTITGLAACNDVSGTSGVAKTNLYTNASDVGVNCWCKMGPASTYNTTTGITSYWVNLSAMANESTCASTCASSCATAMSSNQTFRSAVFEAVW